MAAGYKNILVINLMHIGDLMLVTPVPRRTPLIGVLVIRYRNDSSLSPATLLSPSPIRDMPYRNNETPHKSDNIIDTISICDKSSA